METGEINRKNRSPLELSSQLIELRVPRQHALLCVHLKLERSVHGCDMCHVRLLTLLSNEVANQSRLFLSFGENR